jgi:hypothetical protein
LTGPRATRLRCAARVPGWSTIHLDLHVGVYIGVVLAMVREEAGVWGLSERGLYGGGGAHCAGVRCGGGNE